MAWIVVDLDECLVQELAEEEGGDGSLVAIDGAVQAMGQLAAEGHRLTVFTSRFAPAPDQVRQRLKEQIEGELAQLGFPELEVWTGRDKPAADIFIGANNIPFDNDWGLALAHSQMVMEERGLVPGPMPDDGMIEDDGSEEEVYDG